MARVTKAELENQVKDLRDINYHLRQENNHLKDRAERAERQRNNFDDFAMASSRSLEATAHVIGDISKLIKKERG